jgi:hypothetical protein
MWPAGGKLNGSGARAKHFQAKQLRWATRKMRSKTKHFQAKWTHLAARKMRPKNNPISSQATSLGNSENAFKQKQPIFKPSGLTWRLGKCDRTPF